MSSNTPNTRVPIVVAAFAVVLLGCSESTSVECVEFNSNLVQQSRPAAEEDFDWRQAVLNYVDAHAPDEEAYPVVMPNTPSVREELEAIGARLSYEFHAFSGILVTMKVRHLPKLLDIDSIEDVRMGADGEDLIVRCG